MSVEIKLKNRNGITLNTANKFVEEDIAITIDNSLFAQEHTIEDSLIQGTLTEYYNDRVTTLGQYAMRPLSSSVVKLSFPNLKTANVSFYSLNKLEELYVPNLEEIDMQEFQYCSVIKKIELPKVVYINMNTFSYCYLLEELYLPKVTYIADTSLKYCHSLKKIIIEQTDSVCTLTGTASLTSYCYHFTGTIHEEYNPEGLKDGFIYVPDSMLESYKSATNWSVYADIIVPLSTLQEE